MNHTYTQADTPVLEGSQHLALMFLPSFAYSLTHSLLSMSLIHEEAFLINWILKQRHDRRLKQKVSLEPSSIDVRHQKERLCPILVPLSFPFCLHVRLRLFRSWCCKDLSSPLDTHLDVRIESEQSWTFVTKRATRRVIT